MHTHDLIVIGSGMAGINAVGRAAGDGRRIALVERGMFGGTCPTRGCIPSKALIRSAEIAHEARRAPAFGVRVGRVDVDFAAVMARVRDIVNRGSNGARAYVESLDGVEILDGEATFAGPTAVTVDSRELSAPRIVIATGATPTVPPIPGIDAVPHWTSDHLLRATDLPGRLVVVGGGPIALELGQAMSRLGSSVTIVEVLPRLLPDAEPELAAMLRDYLIDEGVEILTGAEVVEARSGPSLAVRHDGRARTLDADAILVATGRGPAVDGLALERTGVRAGEDGVEVDAHLETGEPGIYAAGDVVGLPYGAFTPVARRMGVSVAENALSLDPHDVDTDVGPTAIFTDPELSSVGLTEAAARDAGRDLAVGTATFSGGKARAWGEERGMVKVLVERGTRRILGAHILAYHGADLIHPVAVAMKAPGGLVDPLLAAMHIHPTLGEPVQSAARRAVDGI